ncbi:MAG: Smr/MutS family protein [Bacteroidota bacterium]
MKLYPADILDKLEFNKIIDLLKEQTISELGLDWCVKLRPTSDASYIKKSLRQIAEFKELQNSGFHFPSQNYIVLSEPIAQLQINDYVLAEEHLLAIKVFCDTIESIFQFLQTHNEQAPSLYHIIQSLKYEAAIALKIDLIIDETATVRSNASKELERIRKDKISKSRELDNAFRKIASQLKLAGFTTDTAESIRNGRRVVSVYAENKRQIKGIIHDESESGKTVYIEPEETVFLNNELFELERAEKREIYKILKTLCNEIRIYTPTLEQYQKLLGLCDFTRAKAKLSFMLDANEPGVLNQAQMKLVKAYHPLLKLIHKKSHKETIPHTASINKEQQIILVSGPNAGGKSVTLKTFALIQLMFQSGLHIPADNTTELGIFDHIMADVGDSQSLEDELSTYSSRLRYMKYFVEHANEHTLFFIDEFGTGTDPVFGGAMAESILKELLAKKAKGIINTHYGNLKIFAERHPNIVNAAMIFDEEHLSPTYKMQIGKPGSSYTFVIARKNELPENIIAYAQKLIGNNVVKYEDLLSKIESERKDIVKAGDDIEKQDKRLKELIRKFEIQNKEIEYQKKKLKYDYYLQKQEFENKLEVELQKVVKEIQQEKNAAEQKAKEALKNIQQEKNISTQLVDKSKKELHLKKAPISVRVNDSVKIVDTNEIGIVESIHKNKAQVIFGHLKTWISVDMLEVIDLSKLKKHTPIAAIRHFDNESAKYELDIRGMMKEEAFPVLENFLDKAILGNFNEVRIVHGKGSGVLKMLVKQYAKSYKEVKETYHPAAEFGGDGVTMIKFN